MMSLKDKYENYLAKKNTYEKEKFLYDSKEKELRDKVISTIKNVDRDALTALGFNFELEEDQLDNADYLISKIQELKHIREQIEERGAQILVGY